MPAPLVGLVAHAAAARRRIVGSPRRNVAGQGFRLDRAEKPLDYAAIEILAPRSQPHARDVARIGRIEIAPVENGAVVQACVATDLPGRHILLLVGTDRNRPTELVDLLFDALESSLEALEVI